MIRSGIPKFKEGEIVKLVGSGYIGIIRLVKEYEVKQLPYYMPQSMVSIDSKTEFSCGSYREDDLRLPTERELALYNLERA